MLYLRTVNVFSWLIQTIVASVVDMVSFIVVLVIGIIAFADAFLSIETLLVISGDMTEEKNTLTKDSSDYDKFLKAYVSAWQSSFLVALGEFDGNLEFYRDQDWLVFFVCCFFNMIVMLNLLIAIISDSYGRIAGNQVNHTYQEKAR